MGRVIPRGQCARSMPLETWLRPTAFMKKKELSPWCQGEEVPFTAYHTRKGRPQSPVASKLRLRMPISIDSGHGGVPGW